MRASQVLELLRGLGSSAEEVARTLIAEGVKGEIGETGSCPLANYLRGRGLSRVAVRDFNVGWDGGLVDLPAHCAEFVWQFDGSNWPDLIEEDSP